LSGKSNPAGGAASITYRRAHGRLPERDEFRLGHLHANSFGCAAVIDDPEQREASILDHAPQSIDGLCDGLAAVLRDDPGRRLRVVQHQGSPMFSRLPARWRGESLRVASPISDCCERSNDGGARDATDDEAISQADARSVAVGLGFDALDVGEDHLLLFRKKGSVRFVVGCGAGVRVDGRGIRHGSRVVCYTERLQQAGRCRYTTEVGSPHDLT